MQRLSDFSEVTQLINGVFISYKGKLCPTSPTKSYKILYIRNRGECICKSTNFIPFDSEKGILRNFLLCILFSKYVFIDFLTIKILKFHL